ncbi:hypothetical protein Plhal304r1_c064g0152251 [Plasmopara halstedii]
MLEKRTPLRQIQFTGQGNSVVHHRKCPFSSVIPPFIKEKREKGKQAPSCLNANDTASIPPAFDAQSDTSDRSPMADDSASNS